MSDAASTARSARESLALGLNALQSDPSIPPHLVELAAPIAQSMGALHQIEKTGQLVPHADVALSHVRNALGQLQAQPSSHPAVVAAMESVAGSLGLVHQLTRMAQAPAPAQPFAATQAQPQFPPPQQPQTGAQPQYQQPPAQPQYQQPPAQPQYQQPPAQPQYQQPPAQPAFQPPAQPHYQQPPAQPAFQPPAQPPAQQQQPPVGGSGLPVVTAELGAHSPTNFYKGLAGNDIIDHGGLFVSTYKIPSIGAPVRLKVSLPGGYEFEANGIVRWCREASDAGNDAPPGFGAQFTEITQEARQLVYRYVRNREPLFHDDL